MNNNPCHNAVVLGTMPDTVGLPWKYFEDRGCFLDCRGKLIIHPHSHWGWNVTVLTQSHSIECGPGVLGDVIDYGVVVEEGAWICSNSLLCGCRIGAGSVVAAGTVVRGQDVAPGVLVAGNPAKVIARWNGCKWIYASDCTKMLV